MPGDQAFGRGLWCFTEEDVKRLQDQVRQGLDKLGGHIDDIRIIRRLP